MNSAEKIAMGKISLKWMNKSASTSDAKLAKVYSECATELLNFSMNNEPKKKEKKIVEEDDE